MTRLQVRLLFIALLLAFGGAQAQTKKELAAKVLQLQQQGIENVGSMIAGQTSQQMLQAAGQALQRVAADKRDAVGRQVQDDVKSFYGEIEPILKKRATELGASVLGAAYEEKFSEDELKQLIAWLESPVSRKFAQFDAQQGNVLAERLIADTRPTIEPKLKALEATVSKRLGLPAAPATAASAPKKK
jgi:hypothetical protein